MWITPQPSFARLPGVEDRSSSSSPSLSRPSRAPSADLIKPKSKSSKKESKGKGKESPESSSSASNSKSNNSSNQPGRYHSLDNPPLPHEEDVVPSGFGVANEDYNTVTAEYVEAAKHIGYDGQVKNVENEGPLVEGSKAWQEAQHEEEDTDKVQTPDYVAVNGADEFSNPWDASDSQSK